MVFSRSEDGGRTWSAAQVLVGATRDGGTAAMFAFPVIGRAGRIWCFYNKDKHLYDIGFRVTAVLGCHYSDDDGRAWSDGDIEVGYGRTRFDHPDPKVPCNAIVWQKPIRDGRGRPLVTFTRGSSLEVFPASAPTSWGERYCDGQGRLLRFDNLDEGPDPGQVRLTFLPEEEGALRCPMPVEPKRSRGYSCFHEPSAVLLPDGRVFLSASTVSGHLLYSVSQDPDGRRWQQPQPLCYRDGGRPLLHPIASAPMFRLADGRYVIFYHNHDGTRYGGLSPRDMRGRRPTCDSVGAYRPGSAQPIWFGEPRLLCDTQGVGIGPDELAWLANYASLTEHRGERVFWYPDRKHFLLGRYITDEMLAEAPAPA